MSHIDVMKQALEYLQDNQHLIADNERHAYVMEYNAFIERFEQAIAEAEQPAPAQEPVAWRELCRRLYVELFHCDRQMMATLDEDGEPVWTQGKTVRDVLADAKAALETSPPAPTHEPDPDELTIAYLNGIDTGKKRKPLTDEQKDAARWRYMRQKHASWPAIVDRASDIDFDGGLDEAVDEAIAAHGITKGGV